MNSWRRVAEGHTALGRLGVSAHDAADAVGRLGAVANGHGLQRAGETPQFVRLEAFCREHAWQLGIARYAGACSCNPAHAQAIGHAEFCPSQRAALVLEVRTPLGLLCCAAYVATVDHAAGVLLPHLRELARRLEDR